MLSTSELRCEYAIDPVGIDVVVPRLSWIGVGNVRGQEQTAYQVLAASTRAGVERRDADLWDSGKVMSTANLVTYGGKALTSELGVWWCVRVWDGTGEVGPYSAPAYFEMGLLAAADWVADWIGFPGAWPGKAMYFRRDFRIEKPVRRARIYMAGLGYSELRVNGRKANQRVLDPPQTDYSKRVLYSTDGVEMLLREGNNTIGVICGNGWFGSVRLLLQMHIDYTDGTRDRIVTESYWPQPWLVFQGPLQENSIYDGETYDARLENLHWDDPDAKPPAGLVAGGADRPGGRLEAAALEPIQVVETRRAVKITNPGPRIYVFDMGQNMAGWSRLSVLGPAGCRVVLRFAESIYPDGTVNQENLRSARATDIYILKGQGAETWEPRFTYHGFRYVQVEGYPGVPSEGDVVACVVRSAVAAAGSFTCSSDLLNRIDQMVRWTEASNLHGVPTDCPQRDERMGWLNDLAARSEEAIYNFDMARLFAKWVGDIADTQDARTGAITDTAPFRWGRRPADPVSVCYLQIPWLLYVHYGDVYTLQKHYAGMKAWVDYLSGCAQDGIIPYSYYGDWAPPIKMGVSGSQGSSAVSRDTPGELVSTACYAFSLDLLSRIAGVLDRREEGACYAALAEDARHAYHQRFWSEAAGGYASNNQACNAISLYMGMAPPQCAARVIGNLVQDVVERNDCHLTTGNICTKYLLEVLVAAGYGDVAYSIAVQETYPSWGYMLANGATTLWERWELATGSGMNSHNHPMMGSIGSWLYRAIGGIRADAEGPGFGAFEVAPHIDRRLQHAQASLQTIRGEINTAWRVEDGRLQLAVQVPVGSRARVVLPAAQNRALLESGQVAWEHEAPAAAVPGIRAVERDGEFLVCTVGSGGYAFESQLPEGRAQ